MSQLKRPESSSSVYSSGQAVSSTHSNMSSMRNPFQASPPPANKTMPSISTAATAASKRATSPSTAIAMLRQGDKPTEPDAGDDAVLSMTSRVSSKRRGSNGSEQSLKENPFKYLTKEQREAVVENLEIEMADRLMRLRKQVDVLKQNLLFRGEIEIDRIPSYVRPLTMEEFWLKYNGDANAYRQRQAQLKADVQNGVMQLLGSVHSEKNSSGSNASSNNNSSSNRKRQRLEM